MKLVAVGRMKSGPERLLFDRYAARLRPALKVTEIAPVKGSATEQKRREAEGLLSACASNAYVVALDEGGPAIDSLAFAAAMASWQETGRPVHFLIGGAEGLDGAVIRRADRILSFGAMTWPHMLVRVMLAEQIFRAQAINSAHPYHRSGRPA